MSPEHEVFPSAASAWEITVEHGLGRLRLPDLPSQFVTAAPERCGTVPLLLEETAALSLHRVPDLHRDPFDRLLVGDQDALAEDLALQVVEPGARPCRGASASRSRRRIRPDALISGLQDAAPTQRGM